MFNYSSSRFLSDIGQYIWRMASSSDLPTSTTKQMSYSDMETVCAERYKERWILSRHYLIQSDLVDRKVQVFNEADQKRKELVQQTTSQKRPLEDDETSNIDGDLAPKRVVVSLTDASTQTDI
jgi:uncharacterized tellurite resistance protein B-like protein